MGVVLPAEAWARSAVVLDFFIPAPRLAPGVERVRVRAAGGSCSCTEPSREDVREVDERFATDLDDLSFLAGALDSVRVPASLPSSRCATDEVRVMPLLEAREARPGVGVGETSLLSDASSPLVEATLGVTLPARRPDLRTLVGAAGATAC
jgi:hypothetical protein